MEIAQLSGILGNLGEFIGSIAVLATLVYLAMQVNHGKELLQKQSESLDQSNKIAISTAEAELFYHNIEYFKLVLNNQQVADLIAKLHADDHLTAAERQQASALVHVHFQLWISSNSYHKNGLIDDSIHEMMLQAPAAMIADLPGVTPFLSSITGIGTGRYTAYQLAHAEVLDRIRKALEKQGHVVRAEQPSGN